jgi:SAM-dependent methyltransferase
MMLGLPDAPSCARNRDVILDVLLAHLPATAHVLEVASGTGQHAVYFAEAMPGWTWQCSDVADNLPGVSAWLSHLALPNTPPACMLDVMTGPWPSAKFDAVFSSNSLHIMSWQAVECFFAALPQVLAPAAKLVVYGPFNYGGEFTSASNAQFDASLKARDAQQGIRDFEAVDALAQMAGLRLLEDRTMPANNRCLVWARD